MKGGDAVILRLAATVPEPNRDVTYILYEAEEIDAEFNGLNLLGQSHPELMEADFAILMEPSNAEVEAGCQGTLRVEVRATGERAHSARSWKGVNAIHRAAPILERLTAYEPRKPVIDGLEYHEGLNAVGIRGGVAGNVLPDECVVEVNYRFAPDRSEAEAQAVRPRLLRGVRRHGHRQRARRAARARPAGGQGVRRGGRRRRSTPSSAGPTSPASAASASRRSTSAPATRCCAHKQEEHVPVEHIERCERAARGPGSGGGMTA